MRPELPVLIKARALIADPAKWGKGRRHFERPAETYCAAEAVESAAAASSFRNQAFAKLHAAAGVSYQWGKLTGWNDAPERTHAEVLAAFDKAIASAS